VDDRIPIIKEILPEETMAKLIIALRAMPEFMDLDVVQLASVLSPHVQLMVMDAEHKERIFCLNDFYNLREKLIDRERKAFQKRSELLVQILGRPEAKALGMGNG